jgi:hypothetical protein
MSRLPPREIRALRYVQKHTVVPLHQFPYGSFRCDSLIEKQYLLKISIPPKTYSDGYVEYYAVKLSPKGEDALDLSRISNNEARIALILSILALFFTFITAFTPFADWLKGWLSSLPR